MYHLFEFYDKSELSQIFDADGIVCYDVFGFLFYDVIFSFVIKNSSPENYEEPLFFIINKANSIK